MGYISGFGTGFAALILALAASPAAAATGAQIEVDISGVRNARGAILVCLTADPKAYPDCGRDPKSRKLSIPARPSVTARFDNVPPGTYAIALIHDENSNTKMDLAVFLPKEGFGMSRNPKIGFGPPKFKSAQFTVGADPVRLPITMRYMF